MYCVFLLGIVLVKKNLNFLKFQFIFGLFLFWLWFFSFPKNHIYKSNMFWGQCVVMCHLLLVSCGMKIVNYE